MFTFLLIVHALIAAALVGVILMQRSEGGGLGMGQGPAGLMTARGAADFLTRATTILAALFVLMSIGLAALASVHNRPASIDTSLARQAPVVPDAGAPAPAPTDPIAAAVGAAPTANAQAPAAAAPAPAPAPAPAQGNAAVPMER
ncbi:preprotein translocase subunit SecG [Sphingomonas quercus]|uniref:Protein-export membrane protein SecG n=1 Tax=Sphingomonas quercus TaxID=2842451 RepID=A0ABS6BK61_9SPHN|nr:preprotein translocase subunit SecG [Sphingomonas quercus]MBU3078252.1 preprotein translocase subunit SecG [Sphingomonas quercus]